MKRFIIQSSVFLLICMACTVLFWMLIVSERDRILHVEGVETLFLGNSQVMCDINDSIWPQALNMGRLAEQVEQSYAKLKLIHRANPSLRRVMMGFDNSILFKPVNRGDENHANLMHPYFFDCYSADDIIHTLKYSDFDWWQNYITLPFSPEKITPPLRGLFGNVDIHDLNIGCSAWFPHHMTEEAEKQAYGTERHKLSYLHDNRLTTYYFQRIVDYCKDNDLDLIFLTLPNYIKVNPDTSYLVIKNEFFPEVKHIDYFRYDLPKDYFQDVLHLRYDGRDSITRVLMHDLETKYPFNPANLLNTNLPAKNELF